MESRPWQGKRVLIVDDSQGVREEIARLFEILGMEVVGFCENGLQTIEGFKSYKPDLISLDILMPEMHGIDCYRELIKINKAAKCIFISCLSSNQNFVANIKQEIPSFLFLTKPVDEKQLEQCLFKVFTGYQE